MKPVHKGMYAWNAIHAGSFLLYVASTKDSHQFIFLPGPADFHLTHEDFEKALSQGILEFVEMLPDDVYEETINFSLKCPSK